METGLKCRLPSLTRHWCGRKNLEASARLTVDVRMMRLTAPTLDRDEQATPEGIAEVVALLEGKQDPFAILSQSELTYVQILWTAEGYDLEYQERNVVNHHRVDKPLSEERVIAVLQAYARCDPKWNAGLAFSRKEIADLPTKIGFTLGAFFGGFVRGWKEARMKRKSSN